MARIITVIEGDYTVVGYATGTVRRYQPDKVPATVKAWLEARPLPDAMPVVEVAREESDSDARAERSEWETECTCSTSSDPTTSKISAVPHTEHPSGGIAGIRNRNVLIFDFVTAELSLLLLAGVGVWCAWWYVKAIQTSITATAQAVGGFRKAWAIIWPSASQSARTLAFRASQAWRWRSELLTEAQLPIAA